MTNFFKNNKIAITIGCTAITVFALNNKFPVIVKKVITTKSNLKYQILKKGGDIKPKFYDTVTIKYVGKLINGIVFDKSDKACLALKDCIAGFIEGLQLIGVGGKIKLFIPSELAYGSTGIPGIIPPNTDLIFNIQLLHIY